MAGSSQEGRQKNGGWGDQGFQSVATSQCRQMARANPGRAPYLKCGIPAGVRLVHVWFLQRHPMPSPITGPSDEDFLLSARQARLCRRAAATRRAGALPSPAREWRRLLRLQRRLRLQSCTPWGE